MRIKQFVSDEERKPTEEAQRAIANPLHEGSILLPLGPTFDSKAVSRGEDAPPFHGDPAHPPNQLRRVDERLLGAVRSKNGWQALSFRLTNGLRIGHLQPSQVWGADAYVDGRCAGRVVLKIVTEALYPPFALFTEKRYTTADRIANELHAYSALSSLQGRDIPHCYGAFSFELPWGEQAVAFVLEDLHEVGELMWRFAEREVVKLQTVEALHRVMRPSFHQLHRIFKHNIGHVRVHTSDMFVLRGSPVDNPRFVFCSFGKCERADTARTAWEEWDQELAAPYELADERYLQANWGEYAPDELWVKWIPYSRRVEPSVWTKGYMTREEWAEYEALGRTSL